MKRADRAIITSGFVVAASTAGLAAVRSYGTVMFQLVVRAAVLRDEFGGSFGEGEVCGVLPVRPGVGQPGLGGCVSCTDIPCVQLEREGFACGPRSAFAGARGKAARVQEREVFAQADAGGFDEECGRWERLGVAFVRIFVVRRDLNCSVLPASPGCEG